MCCFLCALAHLVIVTVALLKQTFFIILIAKILVFLKEPYWINPVCNLASYSTLYFYISIPAKMAASPLEVNVNDKFHYVYSCDVDAYLTLKMYALIVYYTKYEKKYQNEALIGAFKRKSLFCNLDVYRAVKHNSSRSCACKGRKNVCKCIGIEFSCLKSLMASNMCVHPYILVSIGHWALKLYCVHNMHILLLCTSIITLICKNEPTVT